MVVVMGMVHFQSNLLNVITQLKMNCVKNSFWFKSNVRALEDY